MMTDSSAVKKCDFIYPNNVPIVLLNCKDAYDSLTDREKHYAHYLSKASWIGSLIVMLQTSQESPLIFSLLQRMFSLQSVSELKEVAIQECGFTEEDFVAFLIYFCGIATNLGNYKGAGDSKIVPNLSKEKFEKLVQSSRFAKDFPGDVERLLTNCLEIIFSLNEYDCSLGFPSNGNITKYFSKNITSEDHVIVKNFMKEHDIEAWNTRLFKTTNEVGQKHYEIRLASVLHQNDEEDKSLLDKYTFDGHEFSITRGDYSPLMELMNWNLSIAKGYAANAHQEKMIENFIHSFRTGSLKAHKDGSRFWVKDKLPIVESYIGFIEKYRDPSGMRAEFEGFIAMVNKKLSAKFTELVNSAVDFISLLPWPSTFEKDSFKQPDFTSLDVLTFASSMIPIGICIPNYYEVKEIDGFKNVSLGNVMSVKPSVPPNFVCKKDQDIILENITEALDLNVALHELLGHGSGKQFQEQKDGTFNFEQHKVINFETDKEISSWYHKGETYESVFGGLSSAFEECRAECVALHLSDVPEILKIFGFKEEKTEIIHYTVWLQMILRGLDGLQYYFPKGQSWLQAHSHARYAILNVLLEAGEDFVKVEETTGTDGNPDLLLSVDRSKIASVGKPAIAKFLGRLQLYRATADIQSASELFDKYSAVTSDGKHPFLKYREIVMARKKPHSLYVQHNTFVEGDQIQLRNYEATAEGLIKSIVDRYQDPKIFNILEELWQKDRPYFC